MPPIAKLTPKQHLILQLLANTYGSTKKIADLLCIQESTVRTHRNDIFIKLGVHKTLEAVLTGFQLGMIAIPLPDSLVISPEPSVSNKAICELYLKLSEMFANIEMKLEPFTARNDVIALMDAIIKQVHAIIPGRDHATKA